ncbi:MAG: aspartate-semialdehyde dehydrogenase [Myxococcaceae bacterium]
MSAQVDIAVVGATGVVGREVLNALVERSIAPERLTLLASERSVGEEVEYAGETLPVEAASADSFRGKGLVLFAVPAEATKPLALAAQGAGAWVVDASAAFRGTDVPVVLPAVNRKVALEDFRGRILRCPSACASALLTALEPLRQAYGLTQVTVTALLAASSSGERGVLELEKQTAALLTGKDLHPEVYPHRLGFNVIPQVGEFVDADTREELAWREDAHCVWGEGPASRAISGTAVQVPSFFGHLLSVTFVLGATPSVDEIRDRLLTTPSLKVLDDPKERIYPMPQLVTSDPTVHVGRLRAMPAVRGGFAAVLGVDNVGRGAALNLVETGETLLGRA